MATRRSLEATPGGWPEKAKWSAIATTGHRMKCVGSLSSTSSVGFASHATREEYGTIQFALLLPHDIKGCNFITRLYAGTLWGTRRNINLRQGRPCKIPTRIATNNREILYAIPIADTKGPQPQVPAVKRTRAKRGRVNNKDGKGKPGTQVPKIGVTKAAEDQDDAYGLRCPYGCGQIKWRNTKPIVPSRAMQTNQARIRCNECNKDFHVNKGTCVICNTHTSSCICIKSIPRKSDGNGPSHLSKTGHNKRPKNKTMERSPPGKKLTSSNQDRRHSTGPTATTPYPRKSMTWLPQLITGSNCGRFLATNICNFKLKVKDNCMKHSSHARRLASYT